MNELARHIHKLLLESDFAVIPGFGGFIAHYTPAIRDAKKDLFVPPVRNIGFNDRLTLNDGLLLQSYMNISNCSIQEAQQNIAEAVDKLRTNLEVNGYIELKNLGTLRCDANNNYSFKANPEALTCPQFYGFKPFEILEINQIIDSKIGQETSIHKTAPVFFKPATHKRVLNMAGSVVLVAVAFISVLFFSTPIENTEIQTTSYAKFLSTDIFTPSNKAQQTTAINSTLELAEAPFITEELKVEDEASENSEGFVFSHVTAHDKKVLAKQEIETPASDVSLPTKQVTQEIKVSNDINPFHIIVASSIRKDLAKDMVTQLKNNGYDNAQVLTNQNRVRVSIASFESKDAAYKTLNQLTKNADYANAWVYKAN